MERIVLNEINSLIQKIDAGEYKNLYCLLKKGRKVFVAGAGRSGFIGRCFAMRLRHLGIESYVVGETICPPVQKRDILLVISCAGDKRTILELVKIARKKQATVICITSKKTNLLSKLCNDSIIIPSEKSVQFGNSLFEQVTFIFLETFIEYYREREKVATAEMSKRHTNLE